jgi:ubiquinone/menaquinone biosynthesis C-methylase UbiE
VCGSPAGRGYSRPSARDATAPLDVGCGVLGWLRLLSRWVDPDGEVVGTDIDDAMLAAAARFVTDEQLPNVTLIKDDLFATSLKPASFDLVHARFVHAPVFR